MDNSRIKRLTYRSWHRGCKETDSILGRFADARLGKMEAPFVDRYEELLEEEDADIWNWMTGKTEPPEKYATLIEVLMEESSE